jgi:peptidyl-prolyl cis-trans isomerase SurA
MKRLISLALASLAFLIATTAGAEILERVVAKVNGDIVTLSDFESRQIMAIQAARIGSDKIEEYLRNNNAKILQAAVDDLLIVQRAEELEIHLPPEAVKAAIENIKKDNHLASDDELRTQLRREGMTFDDLRRNITETYLKRAVLQRELERKVAPSEDAILSYYNEHKDEYTGPATVHLRQIFIPSGELLPQDGGPGGAAAGAGGPDARAKARQIVARARGGEDFDALAGTYSAAISDLGVVDLKELSAPIQKAIAPLQVGEVSEAVSGGDGYRIFKLIERAEATLTPLEEVRNQIRNQLMETKGSEAYDKYVEGLRKNAIIDIRVREVPLKVSRPVGPSTLLEPPPEDSSSGEPPVAPGQPAAPSEGPPQPSPATEDEFSVSSQSAPEHVAPPSAPDAKEAKEEDKKDEKTAPPSP